MIRANSLLRIIVTCNCTDVLNPSQTILDAGVSICDYHLTPNGLTIHTGLFSIQLLVAVAMNSHRAGSKLFGRLARPTLERSDEVLRFGIPEFVGDLRKRTIFTLEQFLGKFSAGLIGQCCESVVVVRQAALKGPHTDAGKFGHLCDRQPAAVSATSQHHRNHACQVVAH